MPVFYLDPVGGNDANSGNSYANRWRTITGGPTAARVSAGDEVRIIASPPPVTPDEATWTDNSREVVWASQMNQVIDDCEVAWTGATNITPSTNTARKEGTVCAAFTPLTAFTTGKMAHRTLPAALDLSAYQQVSFWFRHGALVAAGQVELRLCSDTSGDTAVHTIPIPAGTNGAWRTVVWDNGAALSSSIQSISLWATADPGTTAFRIDNIVACLAPSAAGCVTHHHLIGKNTVGEPEWYPIMSIGNSSVMLGGGAGVELGASGGASLRPRNYRGVTETVDTYVRSCLEGWLTADRAIQVSGTPSQPITFSGGWDRTDMSTQNGESYFTGLNYLSAFSSAASRTNLRFTKIGLAHFVGTAGVLLTETGTSGNIDADLEDVCGCVSEPLFAGATGFGFWRLKAKNIVSPQTSLSMRSAETADFELEAEIRSIVNAAIGTSQAAVAPSSGGRYRIGSIKNSGGWGLSPSLLTRPGTYADLYNCVFDYNESGDINTASGFLGELRIWGGSGADPSVPAGQFGTVSYTRKNGNVADHGKLSGYWDLRTSTTERHTLSGVSWRLRPLNSSFIGPLNPAKFELARVAFTGSSTVTVRCWMFRDNSNLTQGMRVRSGHPGITADVVALNTDPANQWNEVVLTFTPTVAGVVVIEGIAYGGTTHSGFFDDLSVSVS